MILKKLFNQLAIIASLPVYILFALIFYFYMSGWFFLPFTIMVLSTTLLVTITKLSFRAKRPKKKARTKPKYFWEHIDQYSFPSGHTALATGLFLVIITHMHLYTHMNMLAILSFLFLCLVAYSRVYLKEHYWRDIIGGIGVGVLGGIIAMFLSPLIAPIFSIGSFFVITHIGP